MRWTPGGPSRDLEDRRGSSGRGFGGGGMRMGLGGMVVLAVLSLVFGQNFFSLAGGGGPVETGAAPPGAEGPVASTPAEDSLVLFVSVVLDDAQNVWTA